MQVDGGRWIVDSGKDVERKMWERNMTGNRGLVNQRLAVNPPKNLPFPNIPFQKKAAFPAARAERFTERNMTER